VVVNLICVGYKIEVNMYIIAVYDVGEKRVVKMLKLCRQYLNWIQNSVFEGELTEVQLKELKYRAKEIMKDDEDSFIIFSSREQKWMDKQVIGKEKNSLDNFL
jgi:CRISPR-associated protein Cas2